MISSDDASGQTLLSWPTENTGLKISLTVGARLAFKGNGYVTEFDETGLTVSGPSPRLAPDLRIDFDETATASVAEDDPLGSRIVVLKCGAVKCGLLGSVPMAGPF